jgi:collagen beta-1,O-galactosyltransferase
MGFDEIYVINLERRPDRRETIESTLNDLGLSYKMTKAVDGKTIDPKFLKDMDIEVLPDYKDPYSGRPITYGEIGCFLSHYNIWKDVSLLINIHY